MNKLLLISLVLLAIFGVTNCDDNEQVGEAGAILTSLLRESEANLKTFDDDWNINFPKIKAIMDSVQGEFNDLEKECFAKKDQIANTDQETENTKHYIEWIGEKIQENEGKVVKLEDAHCKTSNLYVNGLKHNKVALKLIAFIRSAIEKKDSLSLAQKKQMIGQLTVFFEMYAKDQIKALMQLSEDGAGADKKEKVDASKYEVDTKGTGDEKERTKKEIGDKHVDNDKKKIEVENFDATEKKNWPQYKKELLTILTTLETEITEKMENSQDEQINSGVSLADFKVALESENQDLDRHLNEEAERINRLAARRVREESKYDQCIDEINIVFETLLSTRKVYDDKVYAHEDKKKGLQEEVDLFKQVNGMYKTQVSGDDSYGDRELSAFKK